MEQLQKAKAAAEGWLTRVTNKIDSLLVREPPATSSELVEAMEEFDKRLSKLEEVQNQIELEIDPDALEAYLDQADAVRQRTRKTRRLCAEQLQALSAADKDTTDFASINTTSVQARLPKLELPKFNGNITQWQSFWDQFSSHIDNTELPVISKLTYLLSLLEGPAKNVVQGVPHTSANYKTVVDLLKERFGKTERIIHAHVQALLSLQVPIDQGKNYISQLWILRDEVVKHTRSLESLKVTGKQCEVLLTPIIVSRLPTNLRLNWSRDCVGYESDLEWLLKWLKEEIEVLERSEMYKNHSSVSKPTTKYEEKKKVFSKENNEKLFTASALHAISPTESVNCVFCNKTNHKSEKCRKFLALDDQHKFDKIKELHICFKCLSHGHFSKKCKVKCEKCQGNHNVTMCGVKVNVQNVTSDNSSESAAVAMLSGHYSSKTVLQTAKVKVMNKKGNFVCAKLLFDSGCDRTYVTSKFIDKCKPDWVTRTEVPYSSFGGHSSDKDIQSNVYKLQVLNDKGESVSLYAASIPKICNPLVRPVVPVHILDAFHHLNLADDFDDNSPLEIDILVGLDYYWSLITPKDAKQVGTVVAMKSVFGWILSGNIGKCYDNSNVLSMSSNSSFMSSSSQLLCISEVSDSEMSNFWDLELIGISSKDYKKNTQESVVQEFKDKIEFVNGRYEVQLPWKNNSIKDSLMSNEKHALKRLNRLLVRLDKDEDLKAEYIKIFDEYESMGIIEEVPSEEVLQHKPIYYLPHRPVVRLNSSTTKVRPVFDASAKGPNGISLNDCMVTGPSLNPDLVEILIRFRRWPFVVSADIVKAFLQIGVSSQDKNVLRFLMPSKDGVKHMRFNRIIFGNTSSPFILNATIKHHLSNYSDCEVVQDLKKDMYVDNWFSGADTVEEVASKYTTAYNIMADANMSLEKLSSNSVFIKSKFSEQMQILKDNEINTVLGLEWSSDNDVLSYSGFNYDSKFEVSYTKRTVLSLIAKIFDPCGFISPFIMYAKILFQDIWKLGVDWDDGLPEDLETKFKKWVNSTKYLNSLTINRCYFVNVPWKSIKHIEIHGFGDASEKGFGACVYLRVCIDDNCQSSLVISKTRVAPIKKLTLPKLELMGALLCARLVKFVENALVLQIKPKIVCWTDSTITLGWIRSNSMIKDVYVNNRVREIQQLTPPSHWHHCSGLENPADLMTRGLLAEKLVNNDFWFSGPSSLSDPTFIIQATDNSTTINETVDNELVENLVCLTVHSETPMFDVERYNDINKSLRIVGYVLRFISNCKNKMLGIVVESSDFTTEEISDFTTEDLDNAKTRLIYVIQREAFPTEIQALLKNKSVSKNSKLSNLDPFIDDVGILRIKGRLQFSDLGYDSKHPIILPKGHFSKILVRFQHKFLKHAGVNCTISSLKTNFYIFGLRRITKTVVKECLSCCRHDSRPCSQPAAPLPDVRVTPSPPFSVTGIDFAGPLFSADFPGKKFYILLFTCAIVRAIHLELTESMSLIDCMQALRRFVARRGIPNVIYSDNAKTFVAASIEVQKVFGHLAPKWKFNVPRSPWWGGWFERLVGSVKLALRKTLSVKYVSKTELETILVEIESCINSRPLTFVSDEPDLDHYLTPFHFIIGRTITSKPSVDIEPHVVTAEDLHDREKIWNKKLEHFWNVWRKDYIANLPPVVKGFNQKCKLNVGSIVLIKEDNMPRLQWPIGVIVNVYPGRDGLIRSVDVKTRKGVINRSIQRLHDLEINSHLYALKDTLKKAVDIPEVDKTANELSDHISDQNITDDNVYSRRGRHIRRPHKLDL